MSSDRLFEPDLPRVALVDAVGAAGAAGTAGTAGAAPAPVSTGLPWTARPAVGRGFRLQWEEVQQCFVVLYPEGMVQLNGSAGEIMKRCNGERDLRAIVTDLETTYGARDLAPEVRSFVELAVKQKWLVFA